MEILQHTQGIDSKATDSELHGSVVIQLFDKDTDKLVEEVKHDNFFTNALSDIVGGAPYMQNAQFCYNADIRRSQGISHLYIKGLYDDLLGGIILFPQSLGNSTTDYYQPFTNFPTAYASMGSYELTDPKQGTFDPTSGTISNGYQYIYNWGANNGNGTIASVALSNIDCFTYYANPTYSYIPNIDVSNVNNSGGWRVENCFPQYQGSGTNHGFLAADEDGAIMFGMNQASWDFYRYLYYVPLKPYIISLTDSYLNFNNNLAEYALWTYDIGANSDSWKRPSIHISNNKIIIIERTYGANQPAKITTLNKDGTVYDTTTVTWDANLTGSACHYGLANGYVYAADYTTNGIMYKCSISDPTDIETISLSNMVARESIYNIINSDMICSRNYKISNGIILPLTNIDSTTFNALDRSRVYPMVKFGPYIVHKWGSNGSPIATHIDPHYCATKNNLATAITKDNTKAMKVTYTVTQQ